ncbi:MAG: hypothetical protein LBV34_01580, partial [Nocardiopsaceae bacterium]|nr:hypothetical protein [Nocardiopsaceae bacterium]
MPASAKRPLDEAMDLTGEPADAKRSRSGEGDIPAVLDPEVVAVARGEVGEVRLSVARLMLAVSGISQVLPAGQEGEDAVAVVAREMYEASVAAGADPGEVRPEEMGVAADATLHLAEGFRAQWVDLQSIVDLLPPEAWLAELPPEIQVEARSAVETYFDVDGLTGQGHPVEQVVRLVGYLAKTIPATAMPIVEVTKRLAETTGLAAGGGVPDLFDPDEVAKTREMETELGGDRLWIALMATLAANSEEMFAQRRSPDGFSPTMTDAARTVARRMYEAAKRTLVSAGEDPALLRDPDWRRDVDERTARAVLAAELRAAAQTSAQIAHEMGTRLTVAAVKHKVNQVPVWDTDDEVYLSLFDPARGAVYRYFDLLQLQLDGAFAEDIAQFLVVLGGRTRNLEYLEHTQATIIAWLAQQVAASLRLWLRPASAIDVDDVHAEAVVRQMQAELGSWAYTAEMVLDASNDRSVLGETRSTAAKYWIARQLREAWMTIRGQGSVINSDVDALQLAERQIAFEASARIARDLDTRWADLSKFDMQALGFAPAELRRVLARAHSLMEKYFSPALMRKRGYQRDSVGLLVDMHWATFYWYGPMREAELARRVGDSLGVLAGWEPIPAGEIAFVVVDENGEAEVVVDRGAFASLMRHRDRLERERERAWSSGERPDLGREITPLSLTTWSVADESYQPVVEGHVRSAAGELPTETGEKVSGGIDAVVERLKEHGGFGAVAVVFELGVNGHLRGVWNVVLGLGTASDGPEFTVVGPLGQRPSEAERARLSAGDGNFYALGYAGDDRLIIGSRREWTRQPDGLVRWAALPGEFGRRMDLAWDELGLDQDREAGRAILDSLASDSPDEHADRLRLAHYVVRRTHDLTVMSPELAQKLRDAAVHWLGPEKDFVHARIESSRVASAMGTLIIGGQPWPDRRREAEAQAAEEELRDSFSDEGYRVLLAYADAFVAVTHQAAKLAADPRVAEQDRVLVAHRLATSAHGPHAAYRLAVTLARSFDMGLGEDAWRPSVLTTNRLRALEDTSWTLERARVEAAFAGHLDEVFAKRNPTRHEKQLAPARANAHSLVAGTHFSVFEADVSITRLARAIVANVLRTERDSAESLVQVSRVMAADLGTGWAPGRVALAATQVLGQAWWDKEYAEHMEKLTEASYRTVPPRMVSHAEFAGAVAMIAAVQRIEDFEGIARDLAGSLAFSAMPSSSAEAAVESSVVVPGEG